MPDDNANRPRSPLAERATSHQVTARDSVFIPAAGAPGPQRIYRPRGSRSVRAGADRGSRTVRVGDFATRGADLLGVYRALAGEHGPAGGRGLPLLPAAGHVRGPRVRPRDARSTTH